jgi:hypothetical protein
LRIKGPIDLRPATASDMHLFSYMIFKLVINKYDMK